MEFPIKIGMVHPKYMYQGSKVIISKIIISISLKSDFVLANSANPDEMSHYAVFYLELHCLPKYPYSDLLSSKG